MFSVKGKSLDCLQYTIRDCQETMAAMPGNPKCGEYADTISACVEEINRRKTVKPDIATSKLAFAVGTLQSIMHWLDDDSVRSEEVRSYMIRQATRSALQKCA